MTAPTALIWFKRDLRVRDHAPLAEAARFEGALGLVVIEPEWLDSPECHHRHVHFLLDCVAELQRDLALRGLPLSMTEDNLAHMTQAAQKARAKVLLVGMQVPPNYGSDYGNRFSAIFEKVARANKAAVVPFLLRGVADGPDAAAMFQPDRIHPTEQAHPIMLANVWPELRKLLQ